MWLIKQYILRRFYKLKSKIKLGKNITLSKGNFFEGNNAINNHTEFILSKIGYGSYIASNSVIKKTKIGRFFSIGDYVRTGIGQHPTNTFASTHPAFFSNQKQAGFTYVKKNLFNEHSYVDKEENYYVIIENDV